MAVPTRIPLPSTPFNFPAPSAIFISHRRSCRIALLLPLSQAALPQFLHTLRMDPLLRFNLLGDLFGLDLADMATPATPLSPTVLLRLVSLPRRFFSLFHLLPPSRSFHFPTISQHFPSALWLEREVWDLFGIPFSGHPDLRRLLTDYGFRGHPLLRTFPVHGTEEIRYDDSSGSIVTHGFHLQQGFRTFLFSNRWPAA